MDDPNQAARPVDTRAARAHYDLPSLPGEPARAGRLIAYALAWLLGVPIGVAVLIRLGLAGHDYAFGVLGAMAWVVLLPWLNAFLTLRTALMLSHPSRYRLTLDRDRIILRETAGWLSSSVQLKVDNLRHLQIVDLDLTQPEDPGVSSDDAGPVAAGFRTILLALPWQGESLALAWDHDRAALEALADDLASRINERLATHARRGSPERVVTVGKGDATIDMLDAYNRQPPETNAIVEPHETGLTVHLPQLGMRRFAALVALGVVLIVVVVLPGALLLRGGVVQLPADWPIILAGALPLIGGVSVLGLAYVRGRTFHVIDLSEAGLLITRQSPLRVRQWQWTWSELDHWTVGQHENAQQHWLAVTDAAGKTHKLLHDRPPTELAWIAALLRDHDLSYNTPAAAEPDLDDTADPPMA